MEQKEGGGQEEEEEGWTFELEERAGNAKIDVRANTDRRRSDQTVMRR